MKTISDTPLSAAFVMTALLVAFPIHRAAAFHAGGVGECSGCHSSHSAGANNPFLLVSGDPSSTCLMCHMQAGETAPNAHHVATDESDMPSGSPPVQLTPGGDFGWLKKNYKWNAADGGPGGQSAGERHGHNIVAAVYGFAADTTLTAAPGGAYPAAGLSCTSCHDPHGRYRRLADGTIQSKGSPVVDSGSYKTSPDPTETTAVGVYRMLGGKGYSRPGASETFNFDPPAAVAPPDYNRSESGSDTRVAYGGGMSEWCTNCHGAYTGNRNAPGHPAGSLVKMTPRAVSNYNAYVSSGNVTGTSSTAYTSLVPFEMGTSDYALLKKAASTDGSMKAGPDTNSNVMCVSCHRAHASAWDQAARWNMKSEFILYNGDYPGADRTDLPLRMSQGRTKTETRRAYHERPPIAFASYQRTLCNKCHTMD
ncbi:MAG: cytochrome c3 family protein [Deltaproteobacteria bacterium]|nr:cytochrome c3 family protein [Deltaproteobacteria bacterium]